MTPTPASPFANWPVQHFDSRYGFAWYCGAGIVVSHITISHGSEAAAHAYHDFEERILGERAAEVRAAGGIFVVHDWRAMKSHDAGARRVWQQRMQARRRGYLRGAVVCLLKAGPLLRMAVQAANVVASVSQGAKVELTTSIDVTLRVHGITAPTP